MMLESWLFAWYGQAFQEERKKGYEAQVWQLALSSDLSHQSGKARLHHWKGTTMNIVVIVDASSFTNVDITRCRDTFLST
eukprot:610659-Pelagomonas_calceolata.AAC.1